MTTCEFCNSEYDEANFTPPTLPIEEGVCFHCGSEADLEIVPPKYSETPSDSTNS